jgi:hypothetical protein
MPFCPICKTEYNSGEEKCINCKCELAQELPQNEQSDNLNGAETLLVSANDGIELAMIEGRLRSAGIPYYLKNKETGSYMKVLMGYSVFGVDIYVPSNFLFKAMEILHMNMQLQIEDTNTDEDEIAYESEHEFYEQTPEDENEELLNETEQESKQSNETTFLTIIFSPVLFVILIFWLLWSGTKKIVKYLKNC